jgi:hypothetical protein
MRVPKEQVQALLSLETLMAEPGEMPNTPRLGNTVHMVGDMQISARGFDELSKAMTLFGENAAHLSRSMEQAFNSLSDGLKHSRIK